MERPRPRLHFTPARGWLNDPNGLLHWRGREHLFYQHNPDDIRPHAIRWGHAVSEDLLHWTRLPDALVPGSDGPDRDGCFSGDAVLVDGKPVLVYTGHREEPGGPVETPCLAYPEELEELRTWRKYPGNPVIAGPPPGFLPSDFRDHCVWEQDGAYLQLIAAGSRAERGAILLYRSPDLHHWKYQGPLLEAASAAEGRIWECPDLFPLGDAWVLLYSIIGGAGDGRVAYAVGTFDGRRFTPSVRGLLDGGRRFYAPQTFLDGRRRRVLMGWLRELPEEVGDADWCGMMALPRVLSLTADGHLASAPVPELEDLRRPLGSLAEATVQEGPVEVRVSGLPIRDAWQVRLGFQGASSAEVVVAGQGAAPLTIRAGSRDVEAAAGPSGSRPAGTGELSVIVDAGVIEAYHGVSAAAEIVHGTQPRLFSIDVVPSSASWSASAFPLR